MNCPPLPTANVTLAVAVVRPLVMTHAAHDALMPWYPAPSDCTPRPVEPPAPVTTPHPLVVHPPLGVPAAFCSTKQKRLPGSTAAGFM
jgi:hypothetical protein